jgi:hypothetical protein
MPLHPDTVVRGRARGALMGGWRAAPERLGLLHRSMTSAPVPSASWHINRRAIVKQDA